MYLSHVSSNNLSSNPNSYDILNQKFILGLNGGLAMENAGIVRLQTRMQEISLPDVKLQFEHHLKETAEHKKGYNN